MLEAEEESAETALDADEAAEDCAAEPLEVEDAPTVEVKPLCATEGSVLVQNVAKPERINLVSFSSDGCTIGTRPQLTRGRARTRCSTRASTAVKLVEDCGAAKARRESDLALSCAALTLRQAPGPSRAGSRNVPGLRIGQNLSHCGVSVQASGKG